MFFVNGKINKCSRKGDERKKERISESVVPMRPFLLFFILFNQRWFRLALAFRAVREQE